MSELNTSRKTELNMKLIFVEKLIEITDKKLKTLEDRKSRLLQSRLNMWETSEIIKEELGIGD